MGYPQVKKFESSMAREIYVVGNWKMYKTSREATDYIETLLPLVAKSQVNLLLAVPFTSIAPASHFAKGSSLVIGAQNMNDAREGAFTGEIAALMLKEAGASFVILGHSERRLAFGETDLMIHKKLVRALQDDLQPILCVGETLEQREKGETEEVLALQLNTAFASLPSEQIGKVVVAYEPVWAIGTGHSATPKLAQKAHAHLRSILTELFGKKQAQAISIIYGGSVKPNGVSHLMAEKDIDGVLVGGASLDPETFAMIATNCLKNTREKKE
jgi:triosephosphate isomerase